MEYSIGELSKLVNCPIETIRYYEKETIIAKPLRTEGGHRVYSETNLRQLKFVVNARRLGFSLDEVKGLLSLSDSRESCEPVLNLADKNLSAIDQKIMQLQQLKADLGQLTNSCRSCCAPTTAAMDCTIIDGLRS